MVSLLLVLTVSLGAGCDKPAPHTPEAGYRAFAEALRRGDSRTAWSSLSSASRAVVEARSKAISEASKGVIKDDPALMLLQSGTRPAPVGQVKLLGSDGGTAVLEVTSGAVVQQVQMVRDGDLWVVELSDILRETP
jgi:hypothetical protein